MPPDPYTRSYWRFADEFPDIYADDHHYALWCRLRDIADMAWPSAATLPAGTRRASLEALVKAELVIPQPGGRYRIRGMDKQRTARAESARKGAGARWDRMRTHSERNATAERTQSERNAGPDATAMHIPSRAEPSRAAPSARNAIEPDREGLPHLTPAVQAEAEAATGLILSTASDAVLTALDQLVEVHGERVCQTMGRIRSEGSGRTWPQFVFGARNRLEPIPGAPDSKAEREREEADEIERRRKRESAVLEEPWRRELREKLRAEEAARGTA